MVKPVKFTRDSGCLSHDEFLVIFQGDHILIYMYIFAIVLLLGTVLHCIMIDSYVRIFSLHLQAYISASYDPHFFSTVP